MNVVADTLLRRHALIAMLETKMLGLDCIKDLYEKILIFVSLFPFRKKLCVPMSSIWQLLVRETQEGGLMGHFGELKTSEILSEHFYWPHMRKDIHNICEKCLTCKLAKSKVSLHNLYTSLPIPTSPWIDIFMDFILDFPKSKGGIDSIFFSNIAYFIHVTRVMMLHMRPIFFRDVSRLGTKLLFSTTCHPQMDGQTEMINRTLGKLLRCFVKKSLKDWEDWIPPVEFSYNMVFNSTTSYSLLELAYGFNPLSLLDLFPLPIMPNYVNDQGLSKAQFVQRLHDKAWLHMEKKGEKYTKNANKERKEVFFKERDLVLVHLRKECFPYLRKSKLLQRGDDPFKGGKNEVISPTLEGPMTTDRLKRIQEEVYQNEQESLWKSKARCSQEQTRTKKEELLQKVTLCGSTFERRGCLT
ncbi:hypothetical protein CR513_00503, partial [Mucuna pruriens]